MNSIDILKRLLANHLEGSLAAQSYHWNVEGIHFQEFHSLFAEVYEEFYSQVDTLAEYIRIVSVGSTYVGMMSSNVAKENTLDVDFIKGSDYAAMVEQLNLVNDRLIYDFNNLFNAAAQEDRQGLSNYCADRIDALNKLKWKLTVMVK